MSATQDATVLIIGGGVAGLTAAIALDRYGIDSLVVEQVDDVRKSQLGAGLSLGVNAARAFKHLGLSTS
jgi:2-polyprenyl-6-methoxyphenol hydroxylase-like FAD-dependent oxidoreductase